MIRVLLVEDHPIVRAGTRAALTAAGDISVVGETGRGADVLPLARALQPDVALLDLRLEDMSGLDVAHALRAELPALKVLILTAYSSPPYVHALRAADVQGYLLKSAPSSEIVAGVRAVAGGALVFSSEVLSAPTGGRSLVERLTIQEQRVLDLLDHGATDRQIADALSITPRTAQDHVHHILGKLGASTRAQALLVACGNGLLLPPE